MKYEKACHYLVLGLCLIGGKKGEDEEKKSSAVVGDHG